MQVQYDSTITIQRRKKEDLDTASVTTSLVPSSLYFSYRKHWRCGAAFEPSDTEQTSRYDADSASTQVKGVASVSSSLGGFAAGSQRVRVLSLLPAYFVLYAIQAWWLSR